MMIRPRLGVARRLARSQHCGMLLALMLTAACASDPIGESGGTYAPAALTVSTWPALALRPSIDSLAPGAKQGFRLFTSDRVRLAPDSITFTATGGTIDERGRYTAHATPGMYQIKATLPGGQSATATVVIGGDSTLAGPDTPDTTVPELPTPQEPPVTVGSCLSQSAPLITLTGAQGKYDNRKTGKPNTRVDARKATWASFDFAVVAGSDSAPGLCWSGGLIKGDKPPGTAWRVYHSMAGMWVASPGFVVENVRIEEYGDGIRASLLSATDWTVRDVHVVNAHDDCMENDWLHNGRIKDVLFEGCYVFLSSRIGSNSPGRERVSGVGKTVAIDSTLVWLKAMPTVYERVQHLAPGHGPLFKWSSEANPMAVKITNSIFRVDRVPLHGDLKLPPNLSGCANNTMVWLGPGPYPAPLPACFRVTTDVGVWDQAVAAWKARHP